MAVVGGENSFAVGRQRLELLAGLQITTKAVERHAEAIRADIAGLEHQRRDRVVQLEAPEIIGGTVPRMYLELDRTHYLWCTPSWKADWVASKHNQPARGK